MQCMMNCQPQNRKRRNKQLPVCRCQKVKTEYRGGDGIVFCTVVYRSITVYRCLAFRDCRMFCAQSNHWTKDEEEVSYMFMMFEFMFPIIFVMVFGMIIFQFATGIGTWHKNNQSPRLSVSATIVAKRENITHHSHANAGDLSGTHGYHSTSSTSYYVTFQVASGDRMELPVTGSEYGMLAEGDIGKLTFQGTRYLSFERV